MEVRCAVKDILLTMVEGAQMEIRCAEEDVGRIGIVRGKTKIARVYITLNKQSKIARRNRIGRSSSRKTRRQ